jgi:phage shock protein A
MYMEFDDDQMLVANDGTLIQEYLGNTPVYLEDVINALEEVLAENKELERKLNEDYQPKEIDYYDEYGLSEDDFH